MNLEYIFLAIVQAITELFPISSSGHLLLVADILQTPIDQTLIMYLHFWTALGLLIFYRKKILTLLQGLYQELIYYFNPTPSNSKMNKTEKKLLVAIIIATIPTAILGYLLDDIAEQTFYNNTSIAISLGVIGLIMIIINIIKFSSERPKNPCVKYTIVGLIQIIAVIPGISRSGACLITSKILNINYKDALELTFLLGIPMTLGPFVLKLITQPEVSQVFFKVDFVFYGVITVLVELICLSWLKRFEDYKNLSYFGVYRVIVSILLLF